MMKKKLVISMLVLGIIILNLSPASALQQAEVRPKMGSIGYGLQMLNGDPIALNIHGEFGLSDNLGIESMVTYYMESNEEYTEDRFMLDINAKLNFVESEGTNVSALVGMQTEVNNGDDVHPRVGVLVSESQNRDLDLNLGADFLLGGIEENYIGYMMGFDYRLGNNLYAEVEHRRFSGQEKTEGLNLAIRHYFF